MVAFLKIVFLALSFTLHLPAKALVIDICKGITSSIPLAFPGFEGDATAQEMVGVIEKDLNNSGVFNVLGAKGLQTPREAFIKPALADWKSAGEGAAFLSGIVSEENGQLIVDFKIYDIQTEKQLGNMTLKAPSALWRLLAHKVANEVYQRLTGEPGYFDTQIVYTAQSGSATQKKRQIAIIDQDGENCRFLTPANRVSFSPRCCGKTKRVAYCAFHGVRCLTHVLDLNTGADMILPAKGVSISPRFSPDGKDLLVCLAKNGTTNIYGFNLSTKELKKLTSTPGSIEVSPSYSPDGKMMVFCSDRHGGRPKIYVMPANGSKNPVCISAGNGSYHTPIWSPDGRWIAFVKQQNGNYYLGVVAPDGTQERMIAMDHVIDHPSWAPNSRLIIFAAQQERFGPFHLYIVDLSGRALRRLETQKDGRSHEGNHPDWAFSASDFQ